MRIIRTATAALVLATGLVAATGAWAQSNQGQDPQQQGSQGADTQKKEGAQSVSGTLSAADKKFVDDAYNGAQAELQIGQLAIDKGSSDAVKNLGHTLVDDAQRRMSDLKGIIEKDNLSMPQPKAAASRDVDQLSKLSGVAFDRAFITHERTTEKTTIGDFQREARSGKNADLKSFATSNVPTLQSELDQTKNVNAQPQTGVTNKQGQGTQNQGAQPKTNQNTAPSQQNQQQP